MKSLLYSILAAGAAASMLIGCNNVSEVGTSLAEENVVIVVDSAFTLTGRTLPNSVVQSRTLSQLIGAIDAKGFGNITSDFVGQFMPSLYLDNTDLDLADLDSVKLFMQMDRGNWVGDSLVPMGIDVYRLTRDLPYPIYSDFDPEGYYNPNDLFASAVYTASTLSEPDSLRWRSYVYTAMDLPLSFGREILSAYNADSTAFADPERFAKEVFKGLYIRSSYGAGRISDFTTTSIRFYYHRSVYNTDSARYDTTRYVGDYMAVTPEVVVNNNIRYEISPELKQRVAEGQTILAAPAGYEAEIRFPAPEIIASYNKYSNYSRVLNSLKFRLPVEVIDNDYEITPPPYVLMVLKSKKDEFFANNSLADNVHSFYASWDSSTKSYNFDSMRAYLIELLGKDAITPEDYTFIITPVQVNQEASAGSSSYYYSSTSYVVSSIVPYVSKPAMGKILPEKAKITLTFSAANQNNL